jgi:hypothetical protein
MTTLKVALSEAPGAIVSDEGVIVCPQFSLSLAVSRKLSLTFPRFVTVTVNVEFSPGEFSLWLGVIEIPILLEKLPVPARHDLSS